MVTVYQGNTEVTITDPTEVIPVAGRIIHVQTSEGVWLCGHSPKNNVSVVDYAAQPFLTTFKRCPKCQAAR